MKKLLIVGSNTIHTYNYLSLIDGYFDDVLLITDKKREGYSYNSVELDFSLTPKNFFATTKAIEKQIEAYKPDIIHIHQANSYAFYTLRANRKHRIPVVLTAWGSDILLVPKINWLLRKMVFFNLKNANYFTSDSGYMGEEMKHLNPSIKDILIANFGIGIQYSPTEKENIIYSNRLHKKLYRVDSIIKAFEKFEKNHPHENWKLIIAATGEETDSLKRLTNDLGLDNKIAFVGWIDQEQNAQLYSKAKIWVSIPESDATSISLLEAMACACIPVVSDLPANKEWIKDGITGSIVTDLEDDFISKALLIDREKAIEINKNRIAKDGTKEANRQKFIELYTKIFSR